MTMQSAPKPTEPEALSSPRAPLATGTKEQKTRYDALAMILRAPRQFTADEAIDLAEYVLSGADEDDA